MIAQNIFDWVVTTLFGEIPQNAWYTNNLDTLRGAFTVAVCCIVFLLAVGLVVGVWRFFERCLGVRV